MIQFNTKENCAFFNTYGPGTVFPRMAQCNKQCETGRVLMDHRQEENMTCNACWGLITQGSIELS